MWTLFTQDPIEGARVDGGGQTTSTDADGLYRLENITVGDDNSPKDVAVTVMHTDYFDQTRTVTVFCGASIVLDFGRPPNGVGAVEGFVTNRVTGLPIPNVFVGGAFGVAARTDVDGYYKLEDAPLNPDGSDRVWDAQAAPKDFVALMKSVTVHANTTSRLDFEFGEAGVGSLVLAKNLSNPDGAPAPASFTINYDCGAAHTGSASVAAGDSATVSDIPTGTSCTVSEPTLPTVPGYSFATPSFSPSATVTIPETNGSSVTVRTNNTLTREVGSLVLAKKLSGAPGSGAQFTIHWDCGAFGQGDATLAADGSTKVPGIPTGTSCTVSEPTLPSLPGFTFGTPTFSPSATVTIPSENGSSVTVTTNNTVTRDVGALTISKTLDDGGSGFAGDFTIHYDCGTDVGDVTVAAGASESVNGIPTGSSCTVTEPTLPNPPTGYGWATPDISGSPATISAAAPVEVGVANVLVRGVGGLKISKTLDAAGSGFTGNFTIHYNCGGFDVGDVTVAAGASATVNAIPTGSSCTVTEPTLPTAPAGYSWKTAVITGSPATISAAAPVEVTVANALVRDVGALKITKTLDDGGSGFTGNFTIHYDCGGTHVGNVTVAAGASETVNGIPTGSSCTVTEPILPTPPTGFGWAPPDITGSPATISVAVPAEVTVANVLVRGVDVLKISKTLDAAGSGFTGNFTIHYDCGGTDVGDVTVAAGASETVNGIPTGSSCTVTEPTLPTPPAGYSWKTAVITGSPATISAAAPVEVSVANALVRDVGALKISKTLDDGGSGFTGNFTIHYDCGGTHVGNVTVAAGASESVNGIPTGSSCTVTEPTLPTPPVGFNWKTPVITGSPAIINKTAAAEVSVANALVRKPLHFLCYELKRTPPTVGNVTVVDRFGPNTVTAAQVHLMCNPTNKRDEDPTAVTNPNHLTGYDINSKGSPARGQTVAVTDQFGTVRMQLAQTRYLMVPAAKRENSAPPALVSPGDRFVCYGVKAGPFATVRNVKVQDQFGTLNVDLLGIRQFCAPANVNGGQPGAQTHDDDLLCYQTRLSKGFDFKPRSVFINDQFQASKIKLDGSIPMLCVPATSS